MAGADWQLAPWIAAGGAIGAVSRYLVSVWTTRTTFPTGTLVVNVTGTFLLALLLFHDLSRGSVTPTARAFFAIGALGAFTTMSAVGYETVALWSGGEAAKASLNVGLNVVLSLAAAFMGRGVALWLSEVPA